VHDQRDRFTRLVGDGSRCDLARGALEIARLGYPDLEPHGSLGTLDSLARSVAPRLTDPMPVEERVRVLTTYLFDEAGFHGNTDAYYDPRNSFLNDVLERRTGIPISLAVVLIEVGARLGLRVEGVGFPGHFLVRVPTGGGYLLLDPFNGGRPIGEVELLDRLRVASEGRTPPPSRIPAAFLEATPTLGILARMLRNLLHIYVEKPEYPLALAAADLLLVADPHAADVRRTRGLVYLQLDCPAAACDDLRRYLELVPDAPDAAELRARIARLSRRTPTLH
jgi:regulator of sirC expression with transglutaminase-like and TPR domain